MSIRRWGLTALLVSIAVGILGTTYAFAADPTARPNRTAPSGQRAQAVRTEAPAEAPEAEAPADTRPLWRRAISIIPWPKARSHEDRPAEAAAPVAAAPTPAAAPQRERTRVSRTEPGVRANRTSSAAQRSQMARVDRETPFEEPTNPDTRPLWQRLTSLVPWPDRWSSGPAAAPTASPAPEASAAAPEPAAAPATARTSRTSPQGYRSSPSAARPREATRISSEQAVRPQESAHASSGEAEPFPSTSRPRPAGPARPPSRRAAESPESRSPRPAARPVLLAADAFMMRTVTPAHAALGPAMTGWFRERWADRLAPSGKKADYRLQGEYSVGQDGTAVITAYLRGARGVQTFRWETSAAGAASDASLRNRMLSEVEAALPTR